MGTYTQAAIQGLNVWCLSMLPLFLLSAFYEIKPKQKHISCCNLCPDLSLVLLLTPHFHLLSPKESCRCDCSQFASTNRKSLLVCALFGEQLRALSTPGLGRTGWGRLRMGQVPWEGRWGFRDFSSLSPLPGSSLQLGSEFILMTQKALFGVFLSSTSQEWWAIPRVCQRKLRMTTPAQWRVTRWANPHSPPLAAASAIFTPSMS